MTPKQRTISDIQKALGREHVRITGLGETAAMELGCDETALFFAVGADLLYVQVVKHHGTLREITIMYHEELTVERAARTIIPF